MSRTRLAGVGYYPISTGHYWVTSRRLFTQSPTPDFQVSASLQQSSIVPYPLSVIRHSSFIETICQHLTTNYATIFNHTAPRQRLDGAFHPLLPPSPLRSSHLPSLTTRKIISRESRIPRHSSPLGAQECRLWREPRKAAVRLFHGRPWFELAVCPLLSCPLLFYPRSSPPTWRATRRRCKWGGWS